jgi:hypothetical protein
MPEIYREMPHLQQLHLQVRVRVKDEGCWRLGISSGDAAFLVEMPHFPMETHLQHPPQAHIKKFFSLLGDAVPADSAFLVEI